MGWKIVLLVILGLAVIIAVALLYGLSRWQAGTKEMHTRLEAARVPIEPKTYQSGELSGLCRRPFKGTFAPCLRMVNP